MTNLAHFFSLLMIYHFSSNLVNFFLKKLLYVNILNLNLKCKSLVPAFIQAILMWTMCCYNSNLRQAQHINQSNYRDMEPYFQRAPSFQVC